MADALGYASHGGVAAAVRRIESATAIRQKTLKKLTRELANNLGEDQA